MKTRAEFFAEQAESAFRRGRELLAGGAAAEALPWIARARRFAPDDDTLGFAHGMLLLRQGDAAAAARLLEGVARRCDAREAWFGLAAANAALGRWRDGGAALAELLGRHVLNESTELPALADRVARGGGHAGWCGLRADGRLALPDDAGIELRLDGRKLRPGGSLPAAGRLTVSLAGAPLLGSPLDLAALRRVEGLVQARDGVLEGWAWRPADPDSTPEITVRDGRGRVLARATASDFAAEAPRPLARPRRFAVPLPARAAGLLHVAGADGRDLAGSPLDPGLVARCRPVPVMLPARAAVAAGPARAAAAPARPRRRVAVVVPVHGNARLTLDCLDSLFASVPRGTAVIVVDDASPEAELVQALDRLAARRRIRLLRHARNRGFPASANAGLRALPAGCDAVLLNSDTLLPAGWLEALRAAVHAAPDTGTATPLSNDATILSYPEADRANPAPDAAGLRDLAALAARANPGLAVEIPTAIGFCMYIRRECLDDTGLLREDAFAQGYGEENDFCLRARRRGWRHVGVPGVYVAHRGGASFGGARGPLLRRNLAVLEALHPGYRDLVRAHLAADPLAPARRRLDEARFRAAGRRVGRAVLLVTHDSGGGVERVLRERCAALRVQGQRPLVLRPLRDPEGEGTLPGLCVVGEGTEGGFPNLRFRVPGELPALARLLRGARPVGMEVHHLLGLDHALLRLPALLGIPYDVQVHDYAWFCPRVTLTGSTRRYCGEPLDAAECEACIAAAGRADRETLPVRDLRARSAAELGGARAVRAPSADAASRLRRRFPGLAVAAVPAEDDAALPPLRAAAPAARTRVCVVGGIGPEKGYDVLLGCARDAAARDLALEYVLVGHTPDDAALLATGRAFVTGPYREQDAVAEIQAQRAHLAFLPSVWPETWCFTLGEAWRAGLDVAVFDIGAQAERVRGTGRGWVLPLGLPFAAVNNALLAVRSSARHE